MVNDKAVDDLFEDIKTAVKKALRNGLNQARDEGRTAAYMEDHGVGHLINRVHNLIDEKLEKETK